MHVKTTTFENQGLKKKSLGKKLKAALILVLQNINNEFVKYWKLSAIVKAHNVFTIICIPFAKYCTFLLRNIRFSVVLHCSFVADFSFPLTALCRLFLLNWTSLALMQKPLSSKFPVILKQSWKQANNQYKIKLIHFSIID